MLVTDFSLAEKFVFELKWGSLLIHRVGGSTPMPGGGMKTVDQRLWHAGMVAGLLGALALPASAQTAAVEWTGVSKLVSGSCADGTRAQVVERDGTIVMKTTILGRQADAFTIPLSANGSGRAAFQGAAYGRHVIEVPAGKGKRPIRQTQLDGPCQWSYAPQ